MSTAASRAWCRTRRRAGVGAVTLKDLLIGSTPVCLEVAVLVLVVRVVRVERGGAVVSRRAWSPPAPDRGRDR